ncbi:hypothetical protein JDV02_010042 [Purpureocillium takamizusanense]|uniref:O-methyltransferase C-terminal domain-containing protein n=1 Tax=Purpureocillium takamizusanense TaxID=2060973 RepID=A0A9Q8QTA6_9HYPO|nr:uncharacterized protein JDV02_010042 [Purpureocillium takamizusanense]UNI24284.1 hypothetical protein JDV02_010042 [Purpureocillium takamizusanense]
MCQPTSPLQEYAQDICRAAKLVDAYCLTTGHPMPSFGPAAPSITLPADTPLHIREARQKLMASAFRVQQLVAEPVEFVPRLGVHFQNFACIHWLCHFRIISFIPQHESVSYSAVAQLASVPVTQLRRIARMAILHNFLSEPVEGQLAHSAASLLLVTDPKLVDWVLFMADATTLAAAKLAEATDRWGDTTSKTETAFNIAKKTDLGFFDYLAQTPELRAKFAAHMKNITVADGTKNEHLIAGFDWAGLPEGATVVDVGGSNGHTAVDLVTKFPHLQVIVQDLPETVARAWTLLPASARSRISIQAHDFFTPQPVHGAAVYLLRMILHNWPDDKAISILQNLLPALAANPGPQGSRLLIMDTVLPLPAGCSSADAALVDPLEEAMLRARDLTMLEIFNSQERELGAWKRLIDEAWRTDPGNTGVRLELVGNKKPLGSNMNVLEVAVLIQAANGQ